MALAPAQRDGSEFNGRARAAFGQVLPDRLNDAQLPRYAEMALLLGKLDAAVRAYHLLATRQPPAPRWYRAAGDALLAQGRYEQAAEEYLLAMRAQETVEGRRRDFLKVLATLQAGGLMDRSLNIAARWEENFLDDPEVLYRLMNLARAAGNGDRAQHYAVLLLRLREEGWMP